MLQCFSQYALSEAEERAFHRNGFLGPFPRFVDPSVIDALRAKCDDLVSRRLPHPLYGRFAVRDWHLLWPEMLEIFRHPAIVDRMAQLAGEDLTLWRSKIFYKGPGDGYVHWHQDWGWFDGEELGNARPGLMPSNPRGKAWELTVWIALDDITPENGALRFAPGTQHTLYPVEMVPMTESSFYRDPFVGDPPTDVIVERARASKLLLDVDTSRLFDGVDPHAMTRAELEAYVRGELARLKGSVTVGFEQPPDDELALMTMKRGEFVFFTERTMHQSLPNLTGRSRVAIHARVTPSDTLVHPGRLRGEYLDGQDLDITHHRCVLLRGRKRNRANVYLDECPPPLALHPLLGHRLPELAHAPGQHCWERRLDAAAPTRGAEEPPVVAEQTYADMAAAAVAEVHGPRALRVQRSEYPQPLVLRAGESQRVQVVYVETGAGEAEVRVYSRPWASWDAWHLNARLALSLAGGAHDPG